MGILQGLSIRNKLGLLLASVSIFFLVSYSFIILKSIQSDKLVYVYDTSLTYSKTVGDQVHLIMSQTVERAKFYISQYTLRQGFNPVAQAMMRSEDTIEAIFIIPEEESIDNLRMKDKLARSKKYYQLDSSALEHLKKFDTNSQFSILLNPKEMDSWYLFIKHIGRLSRYNVILRLPQERLLKALNGNSFQDIYLTGRKGEVLFSPLMPFNSIPQGEIQKIVSNLNIGASGQQMFEAEIQNQTFLMAVTKVGFKDFVLISPIAKSMAMESLHIIIAKSVIFLLLFLSLSVLISVIAPVRMTQGLLRLFEATLEIKKGNFNVVVPPTTDDEIGGLTTSFNHMTQEIQRLMNETAEKARMANELKTAKTVQETLLPEASLKTDKLSIFGYYESASECGGDWWHHSQQGDKTYIWIGDVTGHGAPAALVTSAAKAVSSVCQEYPDLKVDQIMSLMNKVIHSSTKGQFLMTFFLGCFDEKTGTFTYSIASHEPPFFLPSDMTNIKARDLVVLGENTGARLGQHAESKYTSNEIKLAPGDRLFFYTDGVTDLQNPDGKQFGESQLVRSLFKIGKDEPNGEKFFNALEELLEQYRQAAPLIDDVTFVVLEVRA